MAYDKKWSAKYYLLNRTKILARNNRWNKDNKARAAEISKAWDKANPERRKANGARWQRENPEKVKAIFSKHRALMLRAGGSFTGEEWVSLCKLYGNKCLCCGKRRKLEADHIIPVILRGTSFISNIQPLCRSCNAKKRDKVIDYRGARDGTG